jgi:hypothetical protein
MIFHFGTFHLAFDLASGLSRATQAFTENGFQTLIPPNQLGHSTVGGNESVTITVICVPQTGGLSTTVIAASNDSKTAELARNGVRSTIIAGVVH